MKKFSNYIFFVLGLFACKQNDNTEIYNREGFKIAEGEFINEAKNGKWIYFKENGDTNKIVYYSKDTILKEIDYLEDGSKIEESFRNGKRNGEFIIYYPSGITERVGYFNNNKITGKLITYYKTGNERSYGYYSQGNPVGNYTSFYENGQVEIHTSDIINGRYLVYDSLGNCLFNVLVTNYNPIDTVECD